MARAAFDALARSDRRWRRAVLANVEQVINDILGASPSLRQAVQGGRLTVVGAFYDAPTGQVVFSEPVGLTVTGWH